MIHIFTILTDSCADLRPDFVAAQQAFFVLPMSYAIGEETFVDTPEAGLSSQAFYQRLRDGEVSITAQVNSHAVCEVVRPLLAAGQDVLYIAFSSGLSGTYQSAVLARQELAEEFPQGKFLVVDTLAASAGEGMCVYRAVAMREQGASMEQVADWLLEHRQHAAQWFTVDDLNFLKRGGRCSPAAAFFGTMLSIKPVLHVDAEGHLIAREKVRGRANALRGLVDQMEKLVDLEYTQQVFISNGDCQAEAQELARLIHERLGIAMERFVFSTIGPVIGSHSGPGTIALFFWGKSRG